MTREQRALVGRPSDGESAAVLRRRLPALAPNAEGTLLALATRTASTACAPQTNPGARGVTVFLQVTAASGTGGLAVRFRGIDPISGQATSLNDAPPAVTATGTYAYELGSPGGDGSGDVEQRTAGLLPRTWDVLVSHGDGSSYTYSLSFALSR